MTFLLGILCNVSKMTLIFLCSLCSLQDMAECKSRAPSILADELAACFPKSRTEIEIMDIACGTGRVGEQVCRAKYCNFHILKLLLKIDLINSDPLIIS